MAEQPIKDGVLELPKGRWYCGQSTGEVIPSGRGGHCCTAIGSRLYIFGGADRMPTPFEDIWVCDTEADIYHWTRLTPPYAPEHDVLSRSGSTITGLVDNLFVIGGQDPLTGVIFPDVVAFDLAALEWKRADTAGELPPPRHSHVALALGPSAILVYGGAGMEGPLGDVWVLNTLTWEWVRPTIHGQAPPPREMHAAAMIDDRRVLVYGGRGSDNAVLSDLWVLDTETWSWVANTECGFPRCSHSLVVLNHIVAAQERQTDEDAVMEEEGQAAAAAGPKHAPLPPLEVFAYGGWTGSEVSGDLLEIHPQTLRVSMRMPGPTQADVEAQAAAAAAAAAQPRPSPPPADVRRTPSSGTLAMDSGTPGPSMPAAGELPGLMEEGTARPDPPPRLVTPRFAHVAAAVPDPAGDSRMMVVFGGVTYTEDLRDICVYRYTVGAEREPEEPAPRNEGEDAEDGAGAPRAGSAHPAVSTAIEFEAASALLNLL